ncbi:trihelix transcription factor ASIL2-like isoform X2 [Olea europaea var. sylvestris]|uniref:trihelix transcription factor ASIL2-like isoform X2 n=1 Tax=Olea europaea var. sylvestris TaxID=158386 RepID=UPI000C1CF718|nr:trihelix transcription factor ASIL2-like isoform X2 [Olea europaea var. sylvestris]
MRNSIPHSYSSQNEIEFDDNAFDEDEENPYQNVAENGQLYNYEESKRHPKKRKLESFVSNYEFVPQNGMWSEEESFVLLEVWGERYMELGRRSLRTEDWVEVAEKVLEMSGVERTEMECRSQLDVLKNKYKKERVKVESGHASKWAFFKKMDVLLNMRTRGHCGLGCGIDSGEYVFMNPRVYLDRSNLLDEMRDSPGQSDEEDGEEEELGDEEEGAESAKLLAESIQRFGEIYEKIEDSKRKHMMELEKMRQDFQRELELQKKQIVEHAQAEIAKVRDMDDDDDSDDEDDEDDDNHNIDFSGDNLRGDAVSRILGR